MPDTDGKPTALDLIIVRCQRAERKLLAARVRGVLRDCLCLAAGYGLGALVSWLT